MHIKLAFKKNYQCDQCQFCDFDQCDCVADHFEYMIKSRVEVETLYKDFPLFLSKKEEKKPKKKKNATSHSSKYSTM